MVKLNMHLLLLFYRCADSAKQKQVRDIKNSPSWVKGGGVIHRLVVMFATSCSSCSARGTCCSLVVRLLSATIRMVRQEIRQVLTESESVKPVALLQR